MNLLNGLQLNLNNIAQEVTQHPLNAAENVLLVILKIAACLVVADFLAGLLHWAEDTYLVPGKSDFLDRMIVLPNLDHHKKPGGIREGTYWSTNRVTMSIAALGALGAVLMGVHAWEVYLTLAIASQSNQIHAWGHTSRPPAVVAFLQKIKVLQSAKHHAVHHKAPYGVRYCTTTPFLNPILDRTNFWRGLEWLSERCGAKVVRATEARNGY